MGQEAAGDKVRRYRRLRGLTQAQLAQKAGTAEGYIGKLEAGDIAEPTVDVLVRLAGALEIDVRALADPRLYSGEDVPDWEAALMADPRLDDDFKLAVTQIIRRELARQ